MEIWIGAVGRQLPPTVPGFWFNMLQSRELPSSDLSCGQKPTMIGRVAGLKLFGATVCTCLCVSQTQPRFREWQDAFKVVMSQVACVPRESDLAELLRHSTLTASLILKQMHSYSTADRVMRFSVSRIDVEGSAHSAYLERLSCASSTRTKRLQGLCLLGRTGAFEASILVAASNGGTWWLLANYMEAGGPKVPRLLVD